MSRVLYLRTLRYMEGNSGAAQGAEVVLSLLHEPLTANAVGASLLQSRLTNVERLSVLEALGAVYAANCADQDSAEALARTAGITGRLGLQVVAKTVCRALGVPSVALKSGLKETGYVRALVNTPGAAALLAVQTEALVASYSEESRVAIPSYKRAVATLELAVVLSGASAQCAQALRPMIDDLEMFIERASKPEGPSVA